VPGAIRVSIQFRGLSSGGENKGWESDSPDPILVLLLPAG
jgi:hypothetical protein